MAPAIQIECPAAAIQQGPWGDENWPVELWEEPAGAWQEAQWISLSRQAGTVEIAFTEADRMLGFVRLDLDSAMLLAEFLMQIIPTLE